MGRVPVLLLLLLLLLAHSLAPTARAFPNQLPCDDSSGGARQQQQRPNGLMRWGTAFTAMGITWEQFNNSLTPQVDVTTVLSPAAAPSTSPSAAASAAPTHRFVAAAGGFSTVALITATGTLSGTGTSAGACSRVRFGSPASGSTAVTFEWTPPEGASGGDADAAPDDWVMLRSNGPGTSGELYFPPNADSSAAAESSEVAETASTSVCTRRVTLGSGKDVVVTMNASATAVSFLVGISGHRSWLGFAFSTSGDMTQPTASRALILSWNEDAGRLTVDPFLLENQSPSGVRKLTNLTEIAAEGLDLLSWSVDVNSSGTQFSVSLPRERIEDVKYVIAATGTDGDFDRAYHGVDNTGSVNVGADWLTTCEQDDNASCIIPNEAQVCFDCGRCSYQEKVPNIDFAAYGLTLPNSKMASSFFRVSWRVEPPVVGGTLTAAGEEPYIHLLIQASCKGWAGFGFLREGVTHGMQNTDIYWGGTDSDGNFVFVDAFASTIKSPVSDELLGGSADVFDVAGSRENGLLSIEFKRRLDTGDELFDVPITNQENFPCVWAFSAIADTELNQYHRFNRGFMEATFFSIECDPGEFVVGTQCSECEPGTFCPNQNEGFECPPGTYSDRPRLLSCISCDNSPNVGYANHSGATACTDCPENSERTIATSLWKGSRVEECVCKLGFYHPEGLPGKDCIPCPDGGICFGGTTAPRPRPGYWGLADEPNSFTACSFQSNGACTLASNASIDALFNSLDTDSDLHLSVLEVTTAEQLEPVMYKILMGDSSIFANSSSTRQRALGEADASLGKLMSYRDFLMLVRVDPSAAQSFVPYNRTSSQSFCVPGYSGELCSVCEEGFFRFDVSCVACPDDPTLSTVSMVVGVAVVVGLWIVVAQAAGWLGSDSFDILLLFLQCVSIIMSFDLQYHEWIMPLEPVFTLSAFNLDVLNPTCLVAWNYNYSSLLQLLLPVGLVIVALCRVLVTHLLLKRGLGGRSYCRGCVRVPDSLDGTVNSVVAGVSSFLYLVYSELVIKSLSPFQLISLPDGRSVMKVAPYIEAWSSEHVTLQVVPGILGIIFYVVGVPLAAVVYLWRMKRRHLLSDDDTLSRFQWLYGKYHLRVYYWETVVLLRRLILCVVLVCLDRWPLVQGTVSLGVLVGVLSAQFYSLPYRRESNNMVDTAFITVLIAFNFTGIMFDAGIATPSVFAVLLLLGLAGTIGISIIRCFIEASQTFQTRAVQRRLRLPDNVREVFAEELHATFQSLDLARFQVVTAQALQAHHEFRHGIGTTGPRTKHLRQNFSGGAGELHSLVPDSDIQKASGGAVVAEQRLYLHGAQVVLESLLQQAWANVGKGEGSALQRFQSILVESTESPSESPVPGARKSVPAGEAKQGVGLSGSGLDAATKSRHALIRRKTSKNGDRLLKCILEATHARASMLWVGEAFDVLRKEKRELDRQAARNSARPSPPRRLSTGKGKNRDHAISLVQLLTHLRGMSITHIDRDLRLCMNAHPWRPHVFHGFYGVNFAASKVNVDAMDAFYKVQGWLTSYMADTSDTSVFNDTPNADFYRKLAHNQPHLIDWILQASPDKADAFRDMITELEAFTEDISSDNDSDLFGVSKSSRLADNVIHTDFWASILHWLVFTRAPNRISTMQRLLSLLESARTQKARNSTPGAAELHASVKLSKIVPVSGRDKEEAKAEVVGDAVVDI